MPPLIGMGAWADWILRGLTFLVVSCPCALVISVPLSFFGGIGGASRLGILVKGSNYLEALANVDTVVFDKTGTLTSGTFNVVAIHAQDGIDPDYVLSMAAHAEAFSDHPIAISIKEAYSAASTRCASRRPPRNPGTALQPPSTNTSYSWATTSSCPRTESIARPANSPARFCTSPSTGRTPATSSSPTW